MEGFFIALGLGAFVVTVLLPVITFFAVRGLRQRIESLERLIRSDLFVLLRKSAEPVKARSVPPDVSAPAGPVLSCEEKTELPKVHAGPVSEDITGQSPDTESAMLQAKIPFQQPAPVQIKPAVAVTSGVDSAAKRLMLRMWSWIVVGEEFRRPGLSAEFAIATTWLVRAGIVIAVIAVGFGLQLSISRGLLGPAGRVSLTLACGVGFLLLGLRCMGRRYQMLGQGFIGGGLAMFYFAFYAASMMFHLMATSWSFACMAAVTVSAVVLAVRLEALSVAVLGALGGYLTPVMLKSVHPDLPLLYAYLAVLALGMAGVSLRRQWPLLTGLSLVLNSLLFLLAVGDRCGWCSGQGSFIEITYLCGFFALYSTAVFGYAVLNRVAASPVEIGALFLNALVTFGGGAFMIGYSPIQRAYLAVLALGMAAFYVAHIWYFVARKTFDHVLLSGFIALAVIFLGLALPLLFTGNVLTAMFALQAVSLLWIGRRLDSLIFTRGSVCCYLIVLTRLAVGFLDASSFLPPQSGSYLLGLKDRLAEFILPIATLFLGWRLFHKPPAAANKRVGDAVMRGDGVFSRASVFFVTVFYIGLITYATCELFALSRAYLPSFRMAAVTVTWAIFVFHLITLQKRMCDTTFRNLVLLACTVIFMQWLVWGWMGGEWPKLTEFLHAGAFSFSSAFARLIATLACLAVLLGTRRSLAIDFERVPGFGQLLLRVALVTVFLYLTFESATCCAAYLPGFKAWSVSVVWGCYGLSLLVGGLHFGRRGVRMAGLALFGITVSKIFLVDLSGSDALYKLIAFAALGGVLLLAAYAYLRKQDIFKKVPDGMREES